jgi:uncharacterized membrane protein
LIYPVFATPVRVNDRFAPQPPTLDGMAYMERAVYHDEFGRIPLADDAEAIRWLQQNVAGSPVVLEGTTPNYRWGSRVSVYTGLPAVIGWDWHQKQQRWGYQERVDARLADVKTMLTTVDPATTLALMRQYRVRYVYIGQVERLYFPGPGLEKFEVMPGLKKVYDARGVRIYEVLS